MLQAHAEGVEAILGEVLRTFWKSRSCVYIDSRARAASQLPSARFP